MYQAFEQYLARIRELGADNLLSDGLKGIEKEALRVDPEGSIALTAHPPGLGSALTNRYITTDYSEALLEFVTPPGARSWQTLQVLCDLHQFAYEQLGNELLWATSMPCAVQGDDSVPIARYGVSNVGRMKHVYRRGLGHRYGRVMQAISGVHFNYSFDQRLWPVLHEMAATEQPLADFVSASYFGLLRNFRRYGWLVLYLFGASPAVCKSFQPARGSGLAEFDQHTWYDPHATTLRMSDIGYKNKVQAALEISVNGLREYVEGLSAAISTPHPDYQHIGVKVDGEYRQLNANILQIENEYYSLIRPKRVAYSGEKPTCALMRGGVEYVEVRALDVSPFDPAGVNQSQLRFLELLLSFCLLQDSPPIDAPEQAEIDHNQLATARHGRRPGFTLSGGGQPVALTEAALKIMDQLAPIAELHDQASGDLAYGQSLAAHRAMVVDPERTPSARVLSDMRDNNESFFRFGMRMSATHRDYFRSLTQVSEGRRAQLNEEARRSLEQQARIEAADELSFDEYLARYFAGTLNPRPRCG